MNIVVATSVRKPLMYHVNLIQLLDSRLRTQDIGVQRFALLEAVATRVSD